MGVHRWGGDVLIVGTLKRMCAVLCVCVCAAKAPINNPSQPHQHITTAHNHTTPHPTHNPSPNTHTPHQCDSRNHAGGNSSPPRRHKSMHHATSLWWWYRLQQQQRRTPQRHYTRSRGVCVVCGVCIGYDGIGEGQRGPSVGRFAIGGTLTV